MIRYKAGIMVFLILLTACTSDNQITLNNSATSNEKSEYSEGLGQIYEDLIREFGVIEANKGEISSLDYHRINNSITYLMEKKFSGDKIDLLKQNFQKLKVPVEQKNNSPEPVIAENISFSQTNNQTNQIKENSCQSNKSPIFTHHLTTIDKITTIQTPPRLVSGYLKTHSYVDTKGEKVPIYAPIDMTLTTGAFYEGGPYTLDFQISCEISLRLGHVTEPIEKIKELFPSTPAKDSRGIDLPKKINFQAGELIAYTTGTPQAGNWDFGVYDSSSSNKYAQNKDWNNSPVYTTAVCPYDYFSPELKAEYVQKYNKVAYTNAKADGESFCS